MKLSAQKKKEAVFKVVKNNEKIATIAKEYGIARKTLYGWIGRFNKDKENGIKTFTPRYVRGEDHPKAKYPQIEEKLLRVISEDPLISINRLAKYVPASLWTVWKIIDKNNLNSKEERFKYSQDFKYKLYAQKKKEAVLSVIDNKETVTKVARRYGIARKTFYSWLERYKDEGDSVNVFEKRYVKGKDHHATKYTNVEENLLVIVANNPELSISKLTKYVPVSAWTVWKLLNKYNLNTINQRYAFAQELEIRKEEKVPLYSPETSFGFVSNKIQFLLSETRKIPKFTETNLFTPIKNVPLTLFHFIKELAYFNSELFTYFWIRSHYALNIVPVLLLIILLLNYLRIFNIVFQKDNLDFGGIISMKPISVSDMGFIETNNNITLSGSDNYKAIEIPQFTVEKQTGMIQRTSENLSKILGIKKESKEKEPEVSFVSASGTKIEGIDLKESLPGKYEINLRRSKELKPGKYTINVKDESGTSISKEFSWGILAINTEKSTYTSDEIIKFSITAADKNGRPVCDAGMLLSLVNIDSGREIILTTSDGEIIVNPACIRKEKTLESDYEVILSGVGVGGYEVELLAEIDGETYSVGAVLDVLETLPEQKFDVVRAAPIRVGSGEEYPVVIKIRANSDFKGDVIDTLPKNFLVKPFGLVDIRTDEIKGITSTYSFVNKVREEDQILIWNVDFIKGQTYSLTYSFSDMGSDWTNYYLGPLMINGEEVGEKWELRQDPTMPVGNVMEKTRYGSLRVEDRILHLKEKTLKVSIEKTYFKANEVPIIHLEEIVSDKEVEASNTKSLQERLGISNERLSVKDKNKKIKIEVSGVNGEIGFMTEVDAGNINVEIPTKNLKPGKHTITIKDNETGNFVEQTFLYGVLALNLNKSVYAKGDKAYIQMASLSDNGQTICDSNLELTIIDPEGYLNTYRVADGTIDVSKYCDENNVTDEPDYFVYYSLGTSGEYKFVLTNLENGFSIDGIFLVEELPKFSIERVGATRINPFKSAYVMNINVSSKEDFDGRLSERVPIDFEISNSSDFTVIEDGNYKYLTWLTKVIGGDTITLSYEYQAPKISPEVYLLGPAEFINNSGTVFSESRNWQLASDALNTPTFKAAGTFTAGTGAITPPYPTGGNAPVANDIALLVVTSENEAISLTTANGFAEIGAQANKAAGSAGANPGSRLAVYWKRCTGGDSAPVVADSGNNTEGQIFLFSGVRRTGNPWDVYGEGNDSATNDTSGVIPAATTTVVNTLAVLISSTSYNGDSTAEFANVGASGGWANSNLTSLTEIADNSGTSGLGGGFGIATGVKASASDIGSTTVTLANTSYKGAMSIALAGSDAPTLSISQPDGTSDSVNNTGDTYNITYSLSDIDDVVTAAFYYDTNASGLDGTVILGACVTAAEGTNATCTWDTEGMVPGDYYVYGITTDGITQATAYSPGVLTITGSSPTNTPTFKAAGTFTSGMGSITPPYPTGGNAPVANDIALLVVTSENEAISLTTANGFAEIGAQANKAAGSAGANPASRLAVYWKRCTGSDLNPVVADSGNNNEAQIYLFSGVGRSGNPWDVYGEGNDSALNDTSGVIPAATTTVANTLVVLVSSTSYNGTSTTEFANVGASGGWTNANLLSITERGDNTDTIQLGGGHGLATGIKPAPGDIGSTTVTLANTSYKGATSIALAGKYPSSLSISQPDGTEDTIAQNASYNVTYTLTDSDIVATAAFYYDTNASGLDGTAITGACATAPEGTNVTCSWNTIGVTPGTYYVYGITSDGVNPQVSAYSSSVVTINAAPTVNVDQPDGVSDTIAQNANFTVQYDLADSDNVVTADFYYDTNGSGLDGVEISGCQSQAEGTNQTCIWNTTGVTPGTYYVYGITSDGVNAQVNDYSSGVVTINAAPTVNVDQPDGVSDTIAQNGNYTVQYDLSDSDDVVTANFYYDINGSGLDGVAISGCATQAEGTNQTCIWNTTGVTPGTYYVYGITSDGVNPQVSAYSTGVVTINGSPTITSVSLNGGSDIDLTADTTKNIIFSGTVTDPNGYSDIISATGKMYRSGVGQSCSNNDNNCYSVVTCSLSGCSGNSCTATCTAPVAFFADATDTGLYSSEYWLAWIEATDSFSATGSDTSPTDTTDMNSLLTISTSSSITYGFVSRNNSSSLKNTPVTNAGNRLIDLNISGNNMCTDYPTCAGDQITVDNQEYSSSTFTYGNGTELSGTPTPLDMNIPKSSVIPSNSTGIVYWILGVPGTTPFGDYTGSNTITSFISP